MPRILAVLALVVALGLSSHGAEALPATCLSLPLPTTPLSPNFTLDLLFETQHTSATLWRQPCQDDSGQVAVLLRLTPVTALPYVCSFRARIVQNGVEHNGIFATSTGVSPFEQLCGDLAEPTTVVLLSGFPPPNYDEAASFTLRYTGPPSSSVDIPAAPPPTLTVHPLGCTTCSPGDTVSFEVHITNPGGLVPAELKTGARLPNGSIVSILGRHEDGLIRAGVTVIPLVTGFVLPAGIPAGTYAIEAAILEPELGVTISRSSVPLTIAP